MPPKKDKKDKTIIKKDPITGKKKVVKYSKQAEKVRQEILARKKKPVAKKPAPKYPKKAKVPQKRSKMFPESTTSSPDKPAPAKKATVNKDLLQNVMGVMADVAKDKGKSTKKQVDSKVALDKKAEKGKLTQKAFLEDVVLQDGYDEENDDLYEDHFESEMYLAPNNMTETQEQRFLDRASKRAYRSTEMFQKALFKKLIKGKKFKSFKEASKLFITNINKYHPDLYD